MVLSEKLIDHPDEVDVIVAGGGTAGCIVAARLAAADPSMSVLVVEGGKNNYNDPTIVTPLLYASHQKPESKATLFYRGNKSDKLAGREPIVPAGGVLGGGSSINFMMYTRAQGVDYDSFNAEGWSQKDLLPLLKKIETFHDDNEAIDKSVHGYDGPIHVSDGGFRIRHQEDEFLKVTTSQGYPELADINDFKQINGFSRWLRYASPDGKRQDTAHRYLHPLLQDGNHPKLHVLTETKVDRVIFDGTAASGVVVVPNQAHKLQTGLTRPVEAIIKARKLVIISAGALGTPQILERSGVGQGPRLEKLDIPIVADVKGVGENYQDHHICNYPYKADISPEETIDALLSGRRDFTQALQDKDPILGWNAIDICGKVRPKDEEIAALGPEFQAAWDSDFASSPSRPFMLMCTVSGFLGDPGLVPAGEYLSLATYTAYPYSRGHIHIVSKDINDLPDFETGFMSDEHDLDMKAQLWAYKRQREMMRRLSTYRGEVAIGHPAFASTSEAALVSYDIDTKLEPSTTDERIQLPDLQYSKDDDAAIEQCIRKKVQTTWHSLGTCMMGDLKQGGVVDSKLNVHGTQHLKLCDLSIVPNNVGSNTCNTAMLVGEKAADIILNELQISPK